MENCDQETLATVTLTTPAPSTSTDVKVNGRLATKEKLYMQHLLAVLERCEFVQQVKCLCGATSYAVQLSHR